ncbi:LOW QUALITY PROTEIN: transcriptional activator HlyU [Vibrio sp. JCM 18904]|nr:LOW QUALITY PROTEIN: transcriptional activator HlyU [Vibrio sp. JCM 18904]GAK17630.1 LOW QUALITY PROTEIN: transcriptional activator HlyU [Vibrio sp. JCM 19053]
MNLQEMEQNSAKAVVLLKAMANERRLQILCMLHNQELSVGELCAKLELSQSHYLSILLGFRDELVTTRKEAQTVYYTLKSDEVKALIKTLHSLYCAESAQH